MKRLWLRRKTPECVGKSAIASGAPPPWRNLAADGVLWLVLVALLMSFRAFLVWSFRAKVVPHTDAESFLRCFQTALFFDASIATYAVLPSLLITLVGFFRPLDRWHDRVRRALTWILLSLCALAFVTDVAYIAEYSDQFNHWVFGMIYDDQRAILQTIWRTYPIIRGTVAGCLAVTILALAVNRLWLAASSRLRPARRPISGWGRGVTVLVILAVAVIGLRGSLGRRPIQAKDAAVTGDEFLNKLVPNPFFALRLAIREHFLMLSAKGLDELLPQADLKAAATMLFPAVANSTNLDACLERTAPGAPGARPNHIFIVVMESLDAWSRQQPYSDLHLTDRLDALGREGVEVRSFVSAGDGTMSSLAAIISGLPFCGVHVNYQPAVRAGVPTAAARIFKRLGYRTRLFYSGYLSWQRIGDFCREQGFDEVYGGDVMSAKLTGDEWGVPDETLFNFALAHTDREPTFNVLLSTSYHPPFSVDVEAKGFDLAARQTNALCRGLSHQQLRVLGHLWYSDHCLGNFVEAAERKLDRPIFALTGDHYSRRGFLDRHLSLFETVAVPLVLCGQRALENAPRPATLAGSHNDIVPTLVNLAAPAGFTYHAFGRDLLDAKEPQLGFGSKTVIGPDFVLPVFNPRQAEDLRGGSAPAGLPAEKLALRYRQLHALAWWRAMRGPAWPAEKQ